MVILGIESAAGVAGAAVIADGQLKAEVLYNNKKTHSQTILPMVEQVLSESGFEGRYDEIAGIAITAGPGSFTGLRIGSATAKGLAYAWKKPILSVPTIQAMAVNGYGLGDLICPIMDARRNQVYTGVYSFDSEEKGVFPEAVRFDDSTVMNTVLEQTAIGIDELVTKLNDIGKPVAFLGDAVALHKDYIMANATVSVRFMPAYVTANAGAVAVLGEKYLENGAVQDAFEHAPEYLRQSQAERVKSERELQKDESK